TRANQVAEQYRRQSSESTAGSDSNCGSGCHLVQLPKAILLDFHSFPDTSEWAGSELVLLAGPDAESTVLAHALRAFMVQRQVACAVYSGAYNSIVEEAQSIGLPGLLLEFNESLVLARLHSILQYLVDWLATLLEMRTIRVRSPIRNARVE